MMRLDRLHTNNMLRKPCTSSVVDGPPMFMKTIAVGPFEPGVICVGATVALPLLHCALYDEMMDVAGVVDVARFAAREQDTRRAIARCVTTKRASSRSDVSRRRCRGQNNSVNNARKRKSEKALANGSSLVGR